MNRPRDSFAAIIDLWPSAAEFGRDIGVLDVTARSWKWRGIPAQFWEKTVAAAQARKIRGVTIARLARLAAARGGHASTARHHTIRAEARA